MRRCGAHRYVPHCSHGTWSSSTTPSLPGLLTRLGHRQCKASAWPRAVPSPCRDRRAYGAAHLQPCHSGAEGRRHRRWASAGPGRCRGRPAEQLSAADGLRLAKCGGCTRGRVRLLRGRPVTSPLQSEVRAVHHEHAICLYATANRQHTGNGCISKQARVVSCGEQGVLPQHCCGRHVRAVRLLVLRSPGLLRSGSAYCVVSLFIQ